MDRFKSISLRVKGTGAPDEAQLALIRGYTLADMGADALYVRSFVLAHNAIDRDNECFSEAILADFARTLPGKGLHIKHPSGWDGDTGPGEGRFFAAELKRMSFDEARVELRQPDLVFPPDAQNAVLLIASAYAVRTPDNASLLLKIDGGVAGDISIGFTSKGGVERLTDSAGRELNSYRWKGPGEALEGSLVWLGAQPGARAIKHLSPENTMDPATKALLDAEAAKNKSLQDRIDELTKSVGAADAVRKALGDDAALLDKPEDLVALVTAGKAYQAEQIDEVVRCERALGLCGDSPEAVKAATDAYARMPIANVKALIAHYTPRLPTASKVTGGDPNANRGEVKVPDALDTPC